MATRNANKTSAQRAIRVGVLLGGQLVEERIFAGDVPVRIGQSLRCDLSIPVDSLPQEHTLFASDQGRRLMRLTASMNGRVASGKTIRTDLRSGAEDHGVWTVPLERGMRGRIVVGEATILFQEVARAPVAPKAQLPASIRGSFGDRVDKRLAVIVGMSLVAHIAIGTWASILDRDLAQASVAQINDEYQSRTIIENPVFPTIAQPSSATPTTASTPTQPNIAPVTPTTSSTPGLKRPTPNTSTKIPTTMSEDEIKRLAQVMTGEGPDGKVPGGMKSTKPLNDLDKEIADIKNGSVEIGNDDGGFRKDPNLRIGTNTKPLVEGPGQIEETPGKTEKPGRVTPYPLPPKGPPTSTLTGDMILAKIQSNYLGGLQRCYRKGLATDATLSGKLVLSFTVNERGQVTDADATGLTSEVSSCVEGQMSGWRFAIPRDKAGDATEEDFTLSLAMQPS